MWIKIKKPFVTIPLSVRILRLNNRAVANRVRFGRSVFTGSTSSQPKYVAYYRVSTKSQGESGLGLHTQKAAVAAYVKGSDRRALILAGITEVESGKNNQRVQLKFAIDRAKGERAVLFIAKLD